MTNLHVWIFLLLAGLAAVCLAGCMSPYESTDSITKSPFGRLSDGTPVEIYTLRNGNGCEARICNYGGIVTSLTVPD